MRLLATEEEEKEEEKVHAGRRNETNQERETETRADGFATVRKKEQNKRDKSTQQEERKRYGRSRTK